MKPHANALVCAIYTRKSSEEGLEQEFNSLDAQREACEAFVQSQKHEGWRLFPAIYDDGGYSGGSMDRPALKQLMKDIHAGLIDVVVVYKVDRLSRSLADFSKMVEVFDANEVSFVSVTQQFNTSTSMGRLTLNVLLSFAQFEREITGERIRDKLAASAKKGLWMGGTVPLGYDAIDRKLVVNRQEADLVHNIFERYIHLGNVASLKAELDQKDQRSKVRISKKGVRSGGQRFTRGALYRILKNRCYRGKIVHKGNAYSGEHEPILNQSLWDQAQQVLAQNQNHQHNGNRAKNPSLLAGLLFDDRGNQLSPTHAVKNGKRYRYYVNQALIQFNPEAAGAIKRVAANEIESLVCGGLLNLFGDQTRLIDTVFPETVSNQSQSQVIDKATIIIESWEEMAPSEKRGLIRTVTLRIEMSTNGVAIKISLPGLWEILDIKNPTNPEGTEQSITLVEDAQIKTLGGESRLILKGKITDNPANQSDPTLIAALTQAYAWSREFKSNPELPLKHFADQANCSERFVSRKMHLAYLAPDITQAILDGTQPRHLSLTKLMTGIPSSWEKQRIKFGFEDPIQ